MPTPLQPIPLSPAVPPSILDRMINGVSGHASTAVPDYTKHYHNFFFAIITGPMKSLVSSMKHIKRMFLPEALHFVYLSVIVFNIRMNKD